MASLRSIRRTTRHHLAHAARSVAETLERRVLLAASGHFVWNTNHSEGRPQAIEFRFDGNVAASFTKSDIQLFNLTTQQPYSLTDADLSTPFYDGGGTNQTTATLSIAVGAGPQAFLPDGNWELLIDKDDVRTTAGASLPSDLRMVPSLSVDDLYVLGGDISRNRSVGFEDLLILAQNYSTSTIVSYQHGDSTYDGLVAFSDLLVLAQNYGRKMSRPPSEPGAVVVDTLGQDELRVSWEPPVGQNIDGFRIYRSTDGSNFTKVASVGADARTWTDAYLEEGTKYWYRIRAYSHGDGVGFVSAKRWSVTQLKAVFDLTATPTSQTSSTLTWSDDSTHVKTYEVWLEQPGLGLTKVAVRDADTEAKSALIQGLQPGVSYRVFVKSRNDATEMISEPITFSTEPNPIVIQAGPALEASKVTITADSTIAASAQLVWGTVQPKLYPDEPPTHVGGTGRSFTFEPYDNGSYEISLTVMEAGQPAKVFTRLLQVENVPPRFDRVGGPNVGFAGTRLSYGASWRDSLADQLAGATYQWKLFKSGSLQKTTSTNSTLVVPSTLTTEPGMFEAVVTVTDKDGGSTTRSLKTLVIETQGAGAEYLSSRAFEIREPESGQLLDAYALAVASSSDRGPFYIAGAANVNMETDGTFYGERRWHTFWLARVNSDLTLDNAFGLPVGGGSATKRGYFLFDLADDQTLGNGSIGPGDTALSGRIIRIIPDACALAIRALAADRDARRA
jgi:Fibronectin type III domain